LAYSHADRFAALVAICSFVEAFPGFPRFIPESSTDPYSTLAASVADVPVWIVHGDADEVVPVEESRRMAAALEEAGADVRYEELRGVGHNAWDPAYASEELAVWLFSQQRQ
jgi:predicted peptidase